MSGEHENWVVPGSTFQYSPFQKALPYFPDYGYQVTLHFKDDDFELDETTQGMIKNLITKLNGKSVI